MSILKYSSILLAALTLQALVSCCCTGGLDDDKNPIIAPQYPPVADIFASPDNGIEPLLVTLSAAGSTDSDGIIVQYDWDFDSDGAYDLLDGGVSTTHTYDPAGSYTATVRVTDDDGLSDTDSTGITVGALVPPTAQGVAAPEAVGSTVADFDASTSFDTDGTIVQYDWDFDQDGTYDLLDGGASPVHNYGAFGTFTATVRVTDDDGLTDTAEISVTLTEPANLPPVAAVVPTPPAGNAPLDVVWSADASSDSDGTIAQYDWDMNDDGTFEITNGGVTQNANYPTGGSYTVGVRVTDDDGATDTATGVCDVNNPPVAAVAPNPPSGNATLAVTWDASGSSDSDGTIDHYDWDMDNNGTYEITDGGVSQAANYVSGGIFTVGVRVTDNDGATDTATGVCDVNEPPVAALVGNPSAGVGPLSGTWDASGSTDSDGTVDHYDWDMDNNGTYEITDGGPTQAFNYSMYGTYTVGVRVTDNDGATDTTTASVDVQVGPDAVLSHSPSGGYPPLDVTWDASASIDLDGPIVQYDWDMDNNGTFEVLNGGSTRLVNYTIYGIVTVNVRVVDEDGLTDTATDSVEIGQIPD